MMYERSMLKGLMKGMKEPRRFIQVLMGPRQVGKTTLVTQLLKRLEANHVFVSADAVLATNSSWLEQVWGSARLKANLDESSEIILVIDEIQKLNNWSEAVKKMWDED